MILVRGVCCSVWLRVLFLVPEGILCMPCTLCLLVLGESGQLVSGCRVREASNSCSLWQWYWRCAYRVVVPFCLVGYPLWVALWAWGFRSWWRWRPFHRCGKGVLCLGKLSAGYVAMCCAFPGSSIGFCTLGVISFKNEGVDRYVNMTLSFCSRFGCDYRGGRGCLRL